MFCKNCGKEIPENAVICVNCGVRVEDNELKNIQKVLREGWEKSWDWQEFLALIGFTIFIPLLIGPLIGIIVGLANVWKPGIRKRQAIFLLTVAIITGLLQLGFMYLITQNVEVFSYAFLFVIWVSGSLVGAVLVGIYWEKKSLKWWRGFVASIVISWILSLLVCTLNLVVPKGMIEKKLKKGELKKCPYCAKLITGDAKFCRYCGGKQEQS